MQRALPTWGWAWACWRLVRMAPRAPRPGGVPGACTGPQRMCKKRHTSDSPQSCPKTTFSSTYLASIGGVPAQEGGCEKLTLTTAYRALKRTLLPVQLRSRKLLAPPASGVIACHKQRLPTSLHNCDRRVYYVCRQCPPPPPATNGQALFLMRIAIGVGISLTFGTRVATQP